MTGCGVRVGLLCEVIFGVGEQQIMVWDYVNLIRPGKQGNRTRADAGLILVEHMFYTAGPDGLNTLI